MATSDLTRIRSNIQGLNLLSTLRDLNSQVAMHQLRLGTGKRINSAADDPAGMSIATKLDNRSRILGAVYDNIGQAKNMLSVAEGGLNSINDILVQISEKVISASSDTLGTEERQAISTQLSQMVSEISDIAQQTTFGSTAILNSNSTVKFQTGERTTTNYTAKDYAPTALGLTNLAGLTSTSVIDNSNYQSYLDEVNSALSSVGAGLTNIGSLMNRFTIKESNISSAQTNIDAAKSRIQDADMAKEQLDLTKTQILQQTSTAMLAQANTNSSAILSLFK
jgi:flagellin